MEAAAAGNRRSLSEEIETRLEAASMAQGMADFLFGSGMRLEELLILRRYLEAIKAATTLGGDDPGRWMFYANQVRFAFDRDGWGHGIAAGSMDAAFDITAMAADVRRQVEGELAKAVETLAAHGVPTLPTAYRSKDEAEAAARHFRALQRACTLLCNLAHEPGLREHFAPIYAAAAEWSQQYRRELAPAERERYRPILDLAAASEA
jgi:hypothetical protein